MKIDALEALFILLLVGAAVFLIAILVISVATDPTYEIGNVLDACSKRWYVVDGTYIPNVLTIECR